MVYEGPASYTSLWREDTKHNKQQTMKPASTKEMTVSCDKDEFQ